MLGGMRPRHGAIASGVPLSGGLDASGFGGLGRVFLGTLPVSLHIAIEWGLAAGAIGVVLGVCFPKAITCVCFPFSTLGVN